MPAAGIPTGCPPSIRRRKTPPAPETFVGGIDTGHVYEQTEASEPDANGATDSRALPGIDHSKEVVAFTLKENSDPEHVGHTLNTIRHAIA